MFSNIKVVENGQGLMILTSRLTLQEGMFKLFHKDVIMRLDINHHRVLNPINWAQRLLF